MPLVGFFVCVNEFEYKTGNQRSVIVDQQIILHITAEELFQMLNIHKREAEDVIFVDKRK